MWWLIAPLLIAMAAPGAAQTPADLTAVSAARTDSIFLSLQPSTSIRLQTAGGPVVSGTFRRKMEDGIVLDTGRGEATVSYPIAAAWLERPATGRGARVGAIAGGLSLGVWVLAFAEADCDAACVAPFAVGAGLAGAGLGALAGAAAGSLFSVWRRIIP